MGLKTHRYFFILWCKPKRFSNFSGSGTNGLFTINTRTNGIIGSTNTPFLVPHNIALTPNGCKLYVTHSGATAKVN